SHPEEVGVRRSSFQIEVPDGAVTVAKAPFNPTRCAKALSALAAPERLMILRALTRGPHNVTEIIEALGIKPLNVSHHLTVFKTAGLIAGKKKGRFVWYSLRPGVFDEVIGADGPHEVLNLGCCRLVLPATARPRCVG